MQPSLREPGATEVFISYRTEESGAAAQRLFGLLEEHGLNVFLDAASIGAGDDWNDDIKAALASPSLAVGIVLMTKRWFLEFLEDQHWEKYAGEPAKKDVVLWEEVRLLRSREEADGVKVMPVLLRTADDGNVYPELPDAGATGFDEMSDLADYLKRKQYTWVPPKKVDGFDEVVTEAYDRLRSSVLQRPVPGTGSITAENVPPLALSRLATYSPCRLALLRYAEIAGQIRHDHKAQTILGGEALLRKDFDSALKYLDNARAIAHPEHDGDDEVFRSHLWHDHSLNLFVVASFRGGRPRRRQITEASNLLRTALLKAVTVESGHLTRWPPGDLPQAKADRESAAYVVQMTLVLLWLLWVDFFLARNVHFPEATASELTAAEKQLNSVRHLLNQLADHHVALVDADADRRFLVDRGFFDGLPGRLGAAEAWSRAMNKGHINKLLTGLTREDHEQEADG